MHGYTKASDKQQIQNRLRRIEGQVRGLQRMVEEEAYCVEVLTQIASIVSASEKVALILLEDHIEHCVHEAIAEGEVRGQGSGAVRRRGTVPEGLKRRTREASFGAARARARLDHRTSTQALRSTRTSETSPSFASKGLIEARTRAAPELGAARSSASSGKANTCLSSSRVAPKNVKLPNSYSCPFAPSRHTSTYTRAPLGLRNADASRNKTGVPRNAGGTSTVSVTESFPKSVTAIRLFAGL